MSLIEGLQKEMNRNRKLLKVYESIPNGSFGAMFIRKDIECAEKAIAESDTIRMMQVLKSLSEHN